MRIGSRWFDPWVSQNSFRGLTIVTAKGLIPLSPLPIFVTIIMRKSSQRIGKNIVKSIGKKNSSQECMDRRTGDRNSTEIMLKPT